MVKVDNLYVFCISLKDRDDRRQKILNHFSFFNIIFFDAIDTRGNKFRDYYRIIDKTHFYKLITDNFRGMRDYHHNLTSGSVGCYLSHLNVCQYIVNHQLPYNLILEDDTQPLISNYKEYLQYIFNEIPYDADIVLLHYILPYDQYKSIHKLNSAVSIVDRNQFQFFCLDSYIMTLNGAQKILKNFDKIEIQYDSFLSKLYREGKINIYICNEQFTTQNDGKTDIQNLRNVLYPTNFNYDK